MNFEFPIVAEQHHQALRKQNPVRTIGAAEKSRIQPHSSVGKDTLSATAAATWQHSTGHGKVRKPFCSSS